MHHAVKQLTGVHHCLIPAYNQSTCTANIKIEVSVQFLIPTEFVTQKIADLWIEFSSTTGYDGKQVISVREKSLSGCYRRNAHGAPYFGYSLRQTGWPVTCLQCFHYGHYVQSSKFEGGYQPQNIIPVGLHQNHSNRCCLNPVIIASKPSESLLTVK
ncbi:Uncharacterised protein [Escherichia coli]|nr:Uncharacterised protein [Escherichia coli]CAD5853803.1 Uncharacterised protein [Escherichia coli]CAD6115333.1 Uncharacterised protein [Escherichia coli]